MRGTTAMRPTIPILHTTGENGKLVDYATRHIVYGDKLMVGYRYWTTTGKHPLFPFGYRTELYDIPLLEFEGSGDGGVWVNSSGELRRDQHAADAEGAEVAQLYVSDPSAKVSRPERELKGFEKVDLAPGETKHVTLNLDARAFSYWSESTHNWAIDPGKFVVRVGGSSADTPLESAITIK